MHHRHRGHTQHQWQQQQLDANQAGHFLKHWRQVATNSVGASSRMRRSFGSASVGSALAAKMLLPASHRPRGWSRMVVPAISSLHPGPAALPQGDHLRRLHVCIRFPDDTEKTVEGVNPGETLLHALEAADLSDVWPGGACGGSCSCSTCRVRISLAQSSVGTLGIPTARRSLPGSELTQIHDGP